MINDPFNFLTRKGKVIPVKKMAASLLALCLTASLAIPASAATPLDYTFSGTGDPEYGKPTSIEVVYTADR